MVREEDRGAMSITLATKGVLWPIGGLIIREQITDIKLTVSEPTQVSSAVSDIDEVRLAMQADDIVATVTTDEGQEVVVTDPDPVVGVKGDC